MTLSNSTTDIPDYQLIGKNDNLTASLGVGDDEDVLIAVQALGNMRYRHSAAKTSPVSQIHMLPAITTSYSPTPALSHSNSSLSLTAIGPHRDESVSQSFTSRMSELPFFNSAIRAYEHGKASSRVVKFGAEFVESSVMSVTKPVLNQLDGFAANSLGRLSSRFNTSSSTSSSSSAAQPMSQDPPVSSSPTDDGDAPEGRLNSSNSSRWQSVLLEAGGIGIAVTAESMRRLKYCLQWLQYATARIDDQILALQNLLKSQSQNGSMSSENNTTSTRMMQINRIRGDLVMTIRQVVEIISNYAGSALPEPARTRVREFILNLPQRWANANSSESESGMSPVPRSPHGEGQSGGIAESSAREEIKGKRRARSGGSSRQNSTIIVRVGENKKTITSPERVGTSNSPRSQDEDADSASMNASLRRILTLATESLDMLHNVTMIFNQSLERAEAWVERLRMVGLEPQETTQQQPAEEEDRVTRRQRAGSSSTVSSFPETPTTRVSRPPSRTGSDEEVSDSEDDPERPPRKTMRRDPKG